jgi:uncharacterized membrane protein YkvA (DUF1232 family)
VILLKKAFNLWARLKAFQHDLYLLYLVARHPETPTFIKGLTGLIALYVLSPIDLVPDFYPIIGYMDELILTPIFINAVLKLVPSHILAACQKVKMQKPLARKAKSWLTFFIISAILIALITYLVRNGNYI